MPSIVCFISTCVHLDNNINNFQELQVCPSSINIEEVTQKTVNILTNRFGFRPIGHLFNNSANSCTDIYNIRSGIKSGYYWIYSRGLSSRKYCNFQWLKLDLNVVKYLIFLFFLVVDLLCTLCPSLCRVEFLWGDRIHARFSS